jgi:hypothetical protein
MTCIMIIGWQSRCRIQNYLCKGLRFYYIWDNVILIIRNAIVHSKVNIEIKILASNNLQHLQDVNGFKCGNTCKNEE